MSNQPATEATETPDAAPPCVTRVVTLPIREIVGSEISVIDTFRRAWRISTDLANWSQRELVSRDTVRTPGMTTLPKYDRAAVFGTVPRRFNRAPRPPLTAMSAGELTASSLYDLWTRTYPERAAWDGSTVSARDIMTNVERTWTHHKSFGRFAVLWKGESRACTYRYPYPWPVPADKGETLRLSRADSERGTPLVSLPMPLPLARVTLRLADGSEFRRQLRQFDILRLNPWRQKQAKITGRFSGGKMVGADLRIVGKFDAAVREAGFTANVFTGPDNLLTTVVDEDDGNPFVYPGDHLLPLITAHDRWSGRRRLALKHELRWPAAKRRKIVEGGQARIDHMNNRLTTEIQTAAKCMVGYLTRHGVSRVDYADSDRSFLPRLDWTALREATRCKCAEQGIEFQLVTGENDNEQSG